MSEVMDIMLKIGVTEEVTHVFEGLSNTIGQRVSANFVKDSKVWAFANCETKA